jgi:hypothetical protein
MVSSTSSRCRLRVAPCLRMLTPLTDAMAGPNRRERFKAAEIPAFLWPVSPFGRGPLVLLPLSEEGHQRASVGPSCPSIALTIRRASSRFVPGVVKRSAIPAESTLRCSPTGRVSINAVTSANAARPSDELTPLCDSTSLIGNALRVARLRAAAPQVQVGTAWPSDVAIID